ncbi:saccharopine dehydrogenase NADP-binding domain-containing protein [Spirillospora sp. NPDC029432]|uniref:saccharopine dehydrogenase family protein n=1 Tax=Spirillospora sp. NPDC029432 TaxID=3154599 RepID=UPI003453149C
MRIAVYGASGYQGKLVLAELAARRGVRPVPAGRDAGRLEKAAAAVGMPDADIRVALPDESLAAALADCDAVVNCAGPFTLTGAAVVRAAISAGCHYVDTAGEQVFVKEVFDAFGQDARRAGVTVVPAANDGCAPTDLLAHLLAERYGPLDTLTSTHVIAGGGGMSRGSLRSLAETVDHFRTGGLAYENGDWRTGTAPLRTEITLPGDPRPTPVMRAPLPEVVTIPRHITVRALEGAVEAALSARLNTAPTPEIIDGLPEGPAEDARDGQRFTYVLDARTATGEDARAVVRGRDTYGITAAIAAEAATRLITAPAAPGVLAPAQAYDPTDFLDALAPHGLTWTITPPS